MSYTPDNVDMIDEDTIAGYMMKESKAPKSDQRLYLVIADVLRYPIHIIAVFADSEDGEHHAMQVIRNQFKSLGGICCRRILPRFVK